MARATASKYRRLDDKRRARLSGGKMVQRQNEFSRRCGCNGAQSQEEESSLPPSFLGWQLRGKQRPRRLQGEMNKLQNMLGPASSGHKAEALWSKPGAESERASELWGGASQKKRKHSRATHNGSQDGNQATGRTQTIDFQAEIYTRVWGRPAAASLCSSLLTGLAFNKCIISKETELDNDVYSEEVWCCVASVKLCQRFSSRPRPAAVTSRESSPDRPCRLYSCFKKGRKCVWVEAASSQL